ncbi:hypothetical protein [Herbidospora mongoliensis]|nr:hypothetical protein [Herbidospora mongoliensis]
MTTIRTRLALAATIFRARPTDDVHPRQDRPYVPHWTLGNLR